MRVPYPGSFLKLVLLAFVLVATPLVVAVVDAYSSLETLKRRAEAAVTRAVHATRDSRALGEQLTALERAARQQLVLRDPAALEAYAARRDLFARTLERIDQQTSDPAVRVGLNTLRDSENRVFAALGQSNVSVRAAEAVGREFGAMLDTSRDVLRKVDARIEADVRDLRVQSEAARQALLKRLLALIPAGLVIMGGMMLLIRRPLRRLGEAIRRLGDGRFEEPITVRGPGDLEELGQQLEWLRQRLHEVDEQKTRFLRHVSHELKTPLTALHEGSQLLSDNVTGTLNTGQREIVGILRDNVSKLRKHIENLLDYSSLRFQPTTLLRETVMLHSLFAQIAEDQKLALAARRIGLDAADNGLVIDADRNKLRVVLDNLVSNAIKYAPEDSTIALHAHRDGARAVIEVSDCGPGLPADDVEALFEPFVQGPPPIGDTIKGTGLGLSIVKELVGAHGGEVVLLRNQPQGTRVRVSLPLET